MLSLFSSGSFGVPETVALSAVAVIGYLFGQRTRKSGADSWTESSRRELKRATSIARALEKITSNVRKDLASHRATVTEFKTRIMQLSEKKQEQSWQEVCEEAEKILGPTLQLANQMSYAYDQIRQQTTQLMSFSEVRTDPLTGVCNRRALEEQLDMMFAMMTRYDRTFSICIFDIDHFKDLNDRQGHLHGDRALQQTAQLIDQTIRDTDIIARYGGEEFVVVMPQTTLAGACIFSDRLRRLVEEEMAITISGGTAEAVHGDTQQTLLSRADSALYSAKANGRNCLYQHTGTLIRPYHSGKNGLGTDGNGNTPKTQDDGCPQEPPQASSPEQSEATESSTEEALRS